MSTTAHQPPSSNHRSVTKTIFALLISFVTAVLLLATLKYLHDQYNLHSPATPARDLYLYGDPWGKDLSLMCLLMGAVALVYHLLAYLSRRFGNSMILRVFLGVVSFYLGVELALLATLFRFFPLGVSLSTVVGCTCTFVYAQLFHLVSGGSKIPNRIGEFGE